MPAACRALIFDLDGTLLDTEPLSLRANTKITAAFGREYTMVHHKKILGRPGSEWPQIVIDDLALHDHITPSELVDASEVIMKKLYAEAAKMPGAVALLERMHALGVPMALATSSGAHAVAVKRAHHPELFDKFSVIVCGDDKAVAHGKPAPDIFLTAGQRLMGDAFDAAQCVVFEDSVQGVKAGRAAGMQVVAIPDQRFHAQEEQVALYHDADEILSSLEAFEPSKYGFVTVSESEHVLKAMA